MVLHQLGGPEEFRVQQTPFPGCVVLRGWWGERLRGGWKAQAGEGGWACMQQCRKTGAWSEWGLWVPRWKSTACWAEYITKIRAKGFWEAECVSD